MSILNEIGHVENPSARIQFLQVAQTTPGQCGICGKGQDKRGFADTQLDFEYWGRLILCCDCTGQIAAVFGFISPSDYEELLGERDLTILQLHEATERIQSLEKVIDGFTDLRNSIRIVATDTLDNLEGNPGETVPTKPVAEPVIESNDRTIEQQRKTPKPDRSKGLLNI